MKHADESVLWLRPRRLGGPTVTDRFPITFFASGLCAGSKGERADGGRASGLVPSGRAPRRAAGRRLAASALVAAVALGLCGCDTVANLDQSRNVAEVVKEDPNASGANIASLSEVIRNNPNDPQAYT